MRDRTRVLVIGLDGATWNIIKPLVEKGKLPTIAMLMNNGCYGDLESCIPPVTFPAWKCYSTGKNPGKLGAYFYAGLDRVKKRIVLHNSTSFRSKELWDYLSANNIACGVLDMPTTYPTKKVNGFIISHGSPRPSGYTYPKELERELADRFAYKIEPEYSFEFSKDTAISSIKSIIQQRFAVARYLLKKFAPPFFHLTIFNIDQIQHFCWKDMEEGHPKYGKVIEDSWTLIDRELKGLLEECCDKETCVILMSDHGFTGNKGVFQMTRWLAERELLKLNEWQLLVASLLFRLGLSRINLHWALGRSRLLVSWLRSLLPRETRQKIVGLLPGEAPHFMGAFIDWRRTKVIPLGDGLYIDKNALNSEEEYEQFRDSLILEVKRIKHPKTGEKLAKEVYKGEEIYLGSYVDLAPDITILTNEGYAIVGRAGFKAREKWVPTPARVTGVHKLEGIFLACGPGIKRGIEIQGAKIYDLAPTILHLFGLPIPKDVDGRVLKEIFQPDSALAKRETEYQRLDEKTRVKEKIRELKTQGKV